MAFHRVARFVKESAAAAVDLVFPPVCTSCHNTIELDESDTPALCTQCRSSFHDVDNACGRCGMPVGPHVKTEDGCVRCRRRHFRFQTVTRLGLYDDELRRACICAKGKNGEAIAGSLAELLCDVHHARLSELQFDVVVSVPQFWLHRATRPHHSADTIAEVIARRLALPFQPELLRKPRRTPDQSHLPRAKRLKNLEKAFAVQRPEWLKGKRVLLVDDIITTGTTANECSRALKAAGASFIGVAVIAVVP